MQNSSVDGQRTLTFSPGQGLGVLFGVVVVVGIFNAIYFGLGNNQIWTGLLFLLYWSAIDDFAYQRLLPCVCGGLLGLGLVWLLPLSEAWLGDKGMIIFLLALMAAIYCLIMKWLVWACNPVAMLFVTVGSLPAIQANLNMFDALIAFLISIVYFGTPVVCVHLLQRARRNNRGMDATQDNLSQN